jgi:transcription elongation GreA/GreB family factor
MLLKQKIHRYCLHLLNQKIEELNLALTNATDAANNETKSSAGDKHETARAMMQLEQEKLGKQLKELEDQRSELEKIDISKTSVKISRGTLIQSDKGFLFLSIGLGKIVVEDKTVFAISPQSPLGLKLTGKKENDVVEFNGMKYTIQKLF